MAGDLPPSSRVTGVRCSDAARITSRPTDVEPVNKRWLKGSAVNARPTDASPRTTATTSGENVAETIRASNSDVAGVYSDGLSITRLPAAKAPASGAMDRKTG